MKLAAHILHWETGRWEGEREGRIRDGGKEEERGRDRGRRKEKGGGKKYQIIVKILGYQQ